jgi:DNA-binding transcriptional regulator YbjK
MKVDIQKKVKIIQKSMESIRRSDTTLHTITFPRLAQELQIPMEELTSFFINLEDIF